jgi:hypothetical protein
MNSVEPELDAEGWTESGNPRFQCPPYQQPMIPVLALESEWPAFSTFLLFSSFQCCVKSQTKASKVRDDKLGGGHHFSGADKYKLEE